MRSSKEPHRNNCRIWLVLFADGSVARGPRYASRLRLALGACRT